jgi:hypothetical protein
MVKLANDKTGYRVSAAGLFMTIGTEVRLPAPSCQPVRSRPWSEAPPGSPQYPGIKTETPSSSSRLIRAGMPMAATNKSLAKNNKSHTGGEATKRRHHAAAPGPSGRLPRIMESANERTL